MKFNPAKHSQIQRCNVMPWLKPSMIAFLSIKTLGGMGNVYNVQPFRTNLHARPLEQLVHGAVPQIFVSDKG